MSVSLARSVAAEATGTALLVATVVGSGIMAERLAGGNMALSLLANTLATGCMLIVLIAMLGPVSGAHFNPAVSLVFVALRQLRIEWLAAYVVAQFSGALLGVLVAHAMFDVPLLQSSDHVRTGPAQWLAEVVATFGLVGTILGVARTRPEGVAYAVGLYIAAAYWFTASTSFANPAVTVGRAFTDSFAGIALDDVATFVVAQLVGAALAWLFFGWLFDWRSPAGRRNKSAAEIMPSSDSG